MVFTIFIPANIPTIKKKDNVSKWNKSRAIMKSLVRVPLPLCLERFGVFFLCLYANPNKNINIEKVTNKKRNAVLKTLVDTIFVL